MVFFLSYSLTTLCQTTANSVPINEFLVWLIKKDHIDLLNEKTYIGTFFPTQADVLKLPLTDLAGNSLKSCLLELMTNDEARIFYSKVITLSSVNWISTDKLPVKYYDKIPYPRNYTKPITYHTLSQPIILNKTGTRILIAENFIADVAFGLGDVILCEYKNGT